MTFEGIPDAALEFYEGLQADNSKAYWTDYKDAYEAAVRAPLQELCEVLAGEFGPARLFRPYRDVRFARDKSPYKTHQGAVVESGDGSVRYLHVDAAGLFVAVGMYQMAPDQVERYRAAVDDARSGRALERAVRAVRDAGHVVGGEQLRTRPRGYPADHPRLELLRHRSLTASHELGAPAWLGTPEAAAVVARCWREMAPLAAWLGRHVGSSRTPSPR